ncbi:MAG: bifunctional UDP-N-acetylglucosamine diphosphorylase/glucosamine-1-phosphate N-acetyltransferase GlmU [Oscillospiraceae bacterium]|nr:bifunctional UDP-N-acetylglucosamine diphosphorylase/glucosamine-1-phosphate N-acetyltransferase GlmU [Oscillospiraceae bacterium]
MSKPCAIVLAAGEGKRMKSKKPKAMACVLFKPMVDWVLDAVEKSGITDTCVVVGHLGEEIDVHIDGRSEICYQKERLGTGHAVMQAVSFLNSVDAENVLILNGDAPFMDSSTIEDSFGLHLAMNSGATVISAKLQNPVGYGRIVRDAAGNFQRIVEQRDASEQEKLICEVNSGAYWFNKKCLLYALTQINQENDAHEYYLTDTIEEIKKIGWPICVHMTDNADVVLGANDRAQLMELNKIARKQVILDHLVNGVDIPCSDGIIIGTDVVIGAETTILPNTIIRGRSEIGEACEIGPNCLIDDSKIGDGVKLRNTEVEKSQVMNGTDIGPFSHVRPNSYIAQNVHIGNFVEVKNSQIGEGTKLPHLSYIGDSDIGKGVNFGCGSLTVNYDGKNKTRTTVKDGAFIGCNANLISPVTIGEYAYIAAGSTITNDVEQFALSIARARQVDKPGWVLEKRPYKNMP